jgi:excisionase family DNA binding protein
MEKEGYRDALAFLIDRFPDKGFLTVNEAAEFLGAHLTTVYDAIRRKKNPLPAKKLCGKIVIPIPALARWMC